MTGTYALNISNVGEVADEMGAIASNIQTVLEDLERETEQSLAGWTSSVRDAYTAAKQVWDGKAAEMVAQAAAAKATLGSITDNYALADYQGLGLWSK